MKGRIEHWELKENPKGEVYKQLMKILVQHSDRFYFITRKELSYDKDKMKRFEPYVINKYKTNAWAGTMTHGPKATVYEIETNEETYQLLINLTNNLYDWVAPKLPEDLTFIKNNFEWFISTTHEQWATFCIRSDFYKKLVFSIEGLQLEFVE